jgi:hypothetical protein
MRRAGVSSAFPVSLPAQIAEVVVSLLETSCLFHTIGTIAISPQLDGNDKR